jgi:signal transduction histidine kinase
MESLHVPIEISQSWQNTVNLMAEVFGVSSAIITRVEPPYIEVFKSSTNPEAPFSSGQTVEVANHFCEKVINDRKPLNVHNALKIKRWQNAPELEEGILSYMGFPLIWPDGKVFGTICLHDRKENSFNKVYFELMKHFKDIVELQLQTIYQNHQLALSNKSKDRLFSVISHDLRGPFSSLIGLTELMYERVDEMEREEVKEISSHLRTTSKNISNLIDNLFRWAQMQTGRLKIQTTSFNLKKLINENIQLFSSFAEEKDVQLVNEIPEKLNLSTDYDVFLIVFRNLLSNAVKFSYKERPVNIFHKRQSGKDIISVTNYGDGIDDKHLQDIFNQNVMYTTEGTNGEKGSGIGLGLCKELVERIGGTLKLQSSPGDKTIFSIEIPEPVEG